MATESVGLSRENDDSVTGEFVTLGDERFYVIRNVDKISPFLVSVISNADHWLFASSNGGLTAGRASPDTALFPYEPVDKLHDSPLHTGAKTLIRVRAGSTQVNWEPFNREHDRLHSITRNLYKNLLGNKLCFEEVNHNLRLVFRYTWSFSDRYGFIRECEIENLSVTPVTVDVVDGLQNILPAGTPLLSQTNTSNLVDAYKWSELDADTGLAMFALSSGITDRAEPSEALRANTAFCLGLSDPTILISSRQLGNFRDGQRLHTETNKRGIRSAYFVNAPLDLAGSESRRWHIIADVEQSQIDVIELQHALQQPENLAHEILQSVKNGSEEIARQMSLADGFQATAEENVSVHHYANVLFNVLRGGIFDDQYKVSSRALMNTIRHFNAAVYDRNEQYLRNLPESLSLPTLLESVEQQQDPQLERLCREYLPIRFGRRHGDPSRPWNRFAIELEDDDGNRLLTYQGNWRDIFQNWEALAFSYPEFVESIIAKFVNASTMDGYNPYRITDRGIDWEVEEPDNPWSYIGYWGDHQIIYLLKLLELSSHFHPERLTGLLTTNIFSYANVPYRIKPFEALLANPKSTVEYDQELAERIEQRTETIGADGKLVLDRDGNVCQVGLIEKLLVPLLAKLSNFVVDGGIWMNTQRPEWNDANNALVGQGLSMVTLYYLRRYVSFLKILLEPLSEPVRLSKEISEWLAETADALSDLRDQLGAGPIDAALRFRTLSRLGRAASDYRAKVYAQESLSGGTSQPITPIVSLLDDALYAIDHSISTNQRKDRLYHSYNLLDQDVDSISIEPLYPMLEGQVAALSSGAIDPENIITIVDALFKSDIYRADQSSFMLYPDRALPAFLEKNRIDDAQAEGIPLLKSMLEAGDKRIVLRDANGCCRFNADFTNVNDLNVRLDELRNHYGDDIEQARKSLQELYEAVFKHKAFTGRSGTMFGFEGLGSIYWHMVAKLLLAVQENFFLAIDRDCGTSIVKRLGDQYYAIRAGIGFNKSPAQYGAFPADPYSHTPKHAGARQPGMTGQVKEEILTRFGELGLRINDGAVRFLPSLLRRCEFVDIARTFRYVDVGGAWRELSVSRDSIAFTWCQVPITYALDSKSRSAIELSMDDGGTHTQNNLQLSAEVSSELFNRTGRIRQITVTIPASALFNE